MGGSATALQADLAEIEGLSALIAACADRLGPVTCLINNAACFDWDSIESLDRQSWQAHLQINLRAPVFLTQAFAKQLPDGARRQRHQHDRPEGSAPRSCILHLHHLQVRPVGRNAAIGTVARTSCQGQRYRTWSCFAQSDSRQGLIRARGWRNFAQAPRQRRGCRRSNRIPDRYAFRDRPDDRLRFGSASRLEHRREITLSRPLNRVVLRPYLRLTRHAPGVGKTSMIPCH